MLRNGMNYLAAGVLVVLILVSFSSEWLLDLLGKDVDIHLSNANLSPGDSNSSLGTDYLGRDVLALLLNGTRYSIAIAGISALLATLIGVFLGTVAGYFGDHKLKLKRGTLLSVSIFIPLIAFYFIMIFQLNDSSTFIPMLIILILSIIAFFFTKILNTSKRFKRHWSLPIDFMNMKFIEILFAIPTYFVLLALSGIFSASAFSLIVIIGITSWPKTALLIRNELLKIREIDYIKSLQLGGIPWYQILYKHAIPNAIGPVLVNFVFFVAGLLVVESTLSFVGVGLPGDIISWGKVLAGFKYNSANWWVAVFPGILILFTILALHRTGRFIRSS